MTINKVSLRLECQADRYADAANHLNRMMVKQTNVTCYGQSNGVCHQRQKEKQNMLVIFVSIALSALTSVGRRKGNGLSVPAGNARVLGDSTGARVWFRFANSIIVRRRPGPPPVQTSVTFAVHDVKIASLSQAQLGRNVIFHPVQFSANQNPIGSDSASKIGIHASAKKQFVIMLVYLFLCLLM